MKHRILFIALAMSLLLALVVPMAFAQSQFIGRWEATDTINGGPYDHLRMHVNRNGNFMLFDDGAEVCGLTSTGVAVFNARAKGTYSVSGNTLTADVTMRCVGVSDVGSFDTTLTYIYDPVTDTLTDSDGLVWNRA